MTDYYCLCSALNLFEQTTKTKSVIGLNRCGSLLKTQGSSMCSFFALFQVVLPNVFGNLLYLMWWAIHCIKKVKNYIFTNGGCGNFI